MRWRWLSMRGLQWTLEREVELMDNRQGTGMTEDLSSIQVVKGLG